MTVHPKISIEDYEDQTPLPKVKTEAGDINFYVPSRTTAKLLISAIRAEVVW